MTAAAAIALGGGLLAYVALGVGSVAAAGFVVATALLVLAAVLLGLHEGMLVHGTWLRGLAVVALVVYLSFNAGGFFPGTQAYITLLLLLALALRVGLADYPFAGFNRWVAIVAAVLALYTAWIAVSALWSESLARSLVEANRALLYLVAFVLFASVVRSGAGVRAMLRGIAAGAVVVCAVAAASRLLPDFWPTEPDVGLQRLSYPLTYWNALALLAALGAIVCAHLTTTLQERALVRLVSAAAVPLFAVTLYFTFSRGGLVAAAVGLTAYLLIARPRGIVGGMLASVPAAAIAVATAYASDALASDDFTSPAAVSDGRTVAGVLGACIVGSAIVRLAAMRLDNRLQRIRLAKHRIRRVTFGAAAGAAAIAVVAALALGVPGAVSRQYDRFVAGDTVVSSGADLRQRFTDPGNNHRLSQWHVAVKAWHTDILRGTGAGTYSLDWAKRRKTDFTVTDAHSLYVEALAELGVVGFVLIVGAILLILYRVAIEARGRRRSLYGVVFALVLTWALHAGVDWDWEMPAVTVAIFCLAGAVLATSRRVERDARLLSFAPRLAAVVAVSAVGLVPALVAVSDNRLDAATNAFAAGDCSTAREAAHDSLSALGSRPEPYELLGYCAIDAGDGPGAVRAMAHAVERDPGEPEYRYGLALARAAAGEDPRADARAALERDPLNPLYQGAVRGFALAQPESWGKISRLAPLPPRF